MAANLAVQAALAGPRLIGRAPLAFLAWAAVRLAEQYVTLAVLMAARFGGAGLGVGPVWAVLLSVPFEAVLVSATLRALLKPQVRTPAFLCLGRIEANMAGLLVLAGLAGAVIALPVTVGAAYFAFLVASLPLAHSAALIGQILAAMVLMRFAPAPAILVDERRIDLPGAWGASKGRYLLLVVLVVGAMALERVLGSAAGRLAVQPELNSWAALFSPSRLIILGWRSLTGVVALTVMAGAVATVWRAAKQTLD